jgi:hypothetical protein
MISSVSVWGRRHIYLQQLPPRIMIVLFISTTVQYRDGAGGWLIPGRRHPLSFFQLLLLWVVVWWQDKIFYVLKILYRAYFMSSGYCTERISCPQATVQSVLHVLRLLYNIAYIVQCPQVATPTEYSECWPCPLFDILLNKYFPAG